MPESEAAGWGSAGLCARCSPQRGGSQKPVSWGRVWWEVSARELGEMRGALDAVDFRWPFLLISIVCTCFWLGWGGGSVSPLPADGLLGQSPSCCLGRGTARGAPHLAPWQGWASLVTTHIKQLQMTDQAVSQFLFLCFSPFLFVDDKVFSRGAGPFWNAHSSSAAQHKWPCFPQPPLTDTLEVELPRGPHTPGLKTSALKLILSAVQSRKCDYFATERRETKKGDAKKSEFLKSASLIWEHSDRWKRELVFRRVFQMLLKSLPKRSPFIRCLNSHP